MASKGDKSLVVSVLLVCAVIAVGVTAYIKYAPADKVVNEKPTETQEVGGGVRILTPYYADGDLKFSDKSVEVPRDTDPMVFAVNSYLRSAPPVPKDAKLNKVTLERSIAVLDFNEAFNYSYGTMDESTVINGILATMGQFSQVQFVKFTIEGQPLESLGNLELVDPLEVIRLPQLANPGAGEKTAKS